MLVTFILVADQAKSDDLCPPAQSIERSIASITALSDVDKEILFAVRGLSESGKIISKSKSNANLSSPQEKFNRALTIAKGDYIQPLSTGFCIDTSQFERELNALQSAPEASSLVRIPFNAKSIIQPGLTSGQLFVYECLTNLELPIRESEQVLFRKTAAPISLKNKFAEGMYTDLVFQLARLGSVIVNNSHRYSSSESRCANIDRFHLIMENTSFLRCVSRSSRELLELLAANEKSDEHNKKVHS